MRCPLGVSDDGAEYAGEDRAHDWRHEHGGDEHHVAVLDEAHEGDHRRQHQQHHVVEGELSERSRGSQNFETE